MPRPILPTLVLTALALVLPAAASAQAPCPDADVAPTAGTLSSARTSTLCLLNQQRTSRGLKSLRLNARLTTAADAYSRSMVLNQFFAHVSAVDGSTLQARVQATRYLPRTGSWLLGENIAWGSGELATPAQIVVTWMHSSGHRHNILTRGFRDIGIGVALGAPEPKPADLGAATYTTDFGERG